MYEVYISSSTKIQMMLKRLKFPIAALFRAAEFSSSIVEFRINLNKIYTHRKKERSNEQDQSRNDVTNQASRSRSVRVRQRMLQAKRKLKDMETQDWWQVVMTHFQLVQDLLPRHSSDLLRSRSTGARNQTKSFWLEKRKRESEGKSGAAGINRSKSKEALFLPSTRDHMNGEIQLGGVRCRRGVGRWPHGETLRPFRFRRHSLSSFSCLIQDRVRGFVIR